MKSSHNLALLTDSYKVSHWKQYPPGTTNVYSYFAPRGGQFATAALVGLQYHYMEYLTKRITKEEVEYAASRWAKHFNDPNIFNKAGWMHIVEKHGGKLPLRIKSLPEGMSVPVQNVLFTVENTDPECYWLTSWFETLLSQLWYPNTVFTSSREIAKIIKANLEKTGNPTLLPFKCHNFGFRGATSIESAAISDMAHAVNFMGSDTAMGFEFAYEYYDEDMSTFSIPAAEHSTVTSWGGPKFEPEAVANMIKQFGNGSSGFYAIVGDSYDIINFCKNILGNQLKHEIKTAKNVLVARPDSGVPEKVALEVIEALGDERAFGNFTNPKGYRNLNTVGSITGDGIKWITPTEHTVKRVLDNLEAHGWSGDNIAFGSGGGLIQEFTRDTQKYSFKCSSIIRNGVEVDVYKQPVTDPGKDSRRGRFKVANTGSVIETINHKAEGTDLLVESYLNGDMTTKYTLKDLKKNAAL